MWESYLLPEEVSAAHARQVLDFLNQAATAAAIAEAVEFPRERDVGVRVAQRILDRRALLNGFRTLEEVYAVPYVGPERFTEIVVSLSGARPPRVVGGISHAELAELRSSIELLRSLIQGGAQARLWSIQATAWVGQTATLLALVADAAGRPLVDQPVTFTTTWGELSALSGVQTVTGTTVTARTNEVGLVELRLRTRFEAPLSDAQRTALEIAAARLPGAAVSPGAASVELADLVREYRAPASDHLREAIDAAYREYGASALRAGHRGQALAQWARVPVSIACFVQDDGDERGQRHLALVTHTLEVRNWLPAFLATFEHDVAADRRLTEELKRAPTNVEDADVFLNDVFISVKAFLNTEQGELGRAIRQRAAQDELQQFYQTGVAPLPAAARLDALGGVREASATIGEGGLPVFRAVDATRRDLTGTLAVDTGLLASRLNLLETRAVTNDQLDAFRTDLLRQTRGDLTTAVQSAQTALQTQLTQQLGDVQSTLSTQIGLKADQTSIDTLTATTVALRRDLDLKADRTALAALEAANVTLGRDVDALTTSTGGLRADVTELSTSLSGLNTRVTRDVGTLVGRIDGIDARLGGR